LSHARRKGAFALVGTRFAEERAPEVHMRTIVLFSSLIGFSAPAWAEPPPPPVLAHVEVVDGGREADYAVAVSATGEPAELTVVGPGPMSTKLRLRRAGVGLEFDVEQTGADHTSFHAHGDLPLPPAGKRVTVARVPRASGTAEVQLTLK
jgi:hypothetical protein